MMYAGSVQSCAVFSADVRQAACMYTVIAACHNIGANVKVSAGSTILKDFPDRVLIEGFPGKVIREL